jgi:hypothetical protein
MAKSRGCIKGMCQLLCLTRAKAGIHGEEPWLHQRLYNWKTTQDNKLAESMAKSRGCIKGT